MLRLAFTTLRTSSTVVGTRRRRLLNGWLPAQFVRVCGATFMFGDAHCRLSGGADPVKPHFIIDDCPMTIQGRGVTGTAWPTGPPSIPKHLQPSQRVRPNRHRRNVAGPSSRCYPYRHVPLRMILQRLRCCTLAQPLGTRDGWARVNISIHGSSPAVATPQTPTVIARGPATFAELKGRLWSPPNGRVVRETAGPEWNISIHGGSTDVATHLTPTVIARM